MRNLSPKDKLFRRLPKAHRDRVVDFREESGLVLGCKYMLYYSDQYTDGADNLGRSFPVVGVKEAVRYIADLERI